LGEHVISNLVPVTPPEQKQLTRLLLEIAVQRRLLLLRKSERDAFESLMSQFAVEVKNRVGDLKEEIRTLRTKLEQLRRLLTELKDNPEALPADIEQEMADMLEEAMQQSEGFQFGGRADAPPSRSKRNGRKGANQIAKELMRLYKELAKRFHPDLARTAEERERRSDLMLRINVAYRDFDLQTLQTISLETQVEGPVATGFFFRQRLAWAEHELTRLKRETAVTEHRVRILADSDAYKLWQSQQETGTALDDLERRTRERLVRERERYNEASSQYVRMSARRRVTLRRAAERTAGQTAAATSGSD
jgi:hypothetical protein